MIIDVNRIAKDKERSLLRSVLDPFFIVPAWHRFIVVVGLFFSSVMELLGLAMIVPLLTAVSFGTEATANNVAMTGGKAGLGRAFASALHAVGLTPNIETLVLLVVVGLSIKSAISIGVMRHVGDLMADITTSVRMAIIRALLAANWSYFARQPLGRLVSGTGAESSAVGESFLCSATLLSMFMQLLAYGVISVFISWKLSILAVVISLAMLLIFGRLIRMTKQASKEHSKKMRELASSFTDSILGMKPIKAMGRQARFASLFEVDAQKLHMSMRTKIVSGEFASEFQEPIIAALLCTGLYIATAEWHLQLHQQVVVGMLLIRLIGALQMLQRTYQRLISLQDLYNSVGRLLKEADSAKEIYTGTKIPTLDYGVNFKAVSFGYASEDQVLQHVDWHLPTGRISALVGASGAGKSTIVDLIMGLRQPARGVVTIDNVDLKEIDITKWRHMIGYVPQEVMLFNDTIYNNVALGEPEFTEAEVIDALTAAGAMSFIDAVPNGVDYHVGERGHRLSGGQRQRIAIARALVRRPALLILDEATTGLDKEIEKEICDGICNIVRERGITVLAISHQPIWSTIADETYVLQRRNIARQNQRNDHVMSQYSTHA